MIRNGKLQRPGSSERTESDMHDATSKHMANLIDGGKKVREEERNARWTGRP